MLFTPNLLLAGVVDLDSTFLIQWGIFLLFFFVVKALVWKPFLEVIERRDHEINGLRVEAEKSEKEAKLREEAYQEKYREAQNAAVERRQSLLAKEQKAAASAIEDAKLAETKIISEKKGEIEQQTQTSRLALREDATQLAKTICEQILGRKVNS
jgi:F-type H+-transporting ATPase subunit b